MNLLRKSTAYMLKKNKILFQHESKFIKIMGEPVNEDKPIRCHDQKNNVTINATFQIKLANLITLYQIILVMIVLCNFSPVYSLNIGGPLPTLYYQPSLIQAGSHTFIAVQDTNFTSTYTGRFTVVLKYLQLQNRNDYASTVSYRNLYYNLNVGTSYFAIWVSSKTISSFALALVSNNQAKLDYVSYLTKINYLLVSQTILKTKQICIYYYFISCDGLNILTTCQQNKSISLTSINYYAFIQFVGNTNTVNSNLSLKPNFKLSVQILSVTIAKVTLSPEYFKFTDLDYFIMFIDRQMFDFSKRKPVMFEYKNYLHPDSIIAIQPLIIDFTQTKHVFQQNTFIGFNGFKGRPFHYQINLVISGDTILAGNIHGIGNSLNIEAIAFYGFTDSCPTHVMAYTCQPCPQNCILCDVALSFHCTQCQKTFVLAADKKSCQCLLPLTIVQGLCGNFPLQCVSSYLLPNQTAACAFCDLFKKLAVKNNTCVCKNGYQLDTAGACQDFCGDGIIYQSQCDDENNASNDGCSQNCLFQSGFQCDVSVSPSICKSQIVLSYSVHKIIKTQNQNSAILQLKIENQIFLPFPVLKQNFQPLLSHLTLKIVISQNPYQQIIIQDLKLLSIDQKNQIYLQFPFRFSVQGLNGEISLNYENTKYKNETQKLNFILTGDNQGLKFQENVAAYKNLGYCMMGGTVLNTIGLFIGFLTPKFIGLQSILTLQLLYYSQLLIAETSKWPPGFSFLKYVKFSGGYNQIMKATQIMPLSQISKKASNLSFGKFFIQNFNINFIILFLAFILLSVITVLRKRAEKKMYSVFKVSKTALSLNKQNSEEISGQIKTKTKQQQFFYNKLNEITFWIGNEIAIWLVLPFLFAISYQFMVPNDQYKIIDLSTSNYILIKIRGIVSFLSLFMIFGIGCNNFVNFWLGISSQSKLLERPQEIIYKRILFIYLFVIVCFVFFFNSQNIGSVYCSTLVLLIQIMYVLALVKIDPYKQSLRVHTIVLLFNNFVFIIFLVVINLINYIDEINSLIILITSYFVTGCVGISIILTFIRLYYELRYGRALQEKIQQQRKFKQQQQKLKKQSLLKKNQQLLQIEAKNKITEKQMVRDKNIFLFQNQIKQARQQDLIKWLQNRNLTQKQKQAYYFKQFTQKPLNWMKKHDREKFIERKQLLQQQQKKRQQKQLQKKNKPQYIAIVQKIFPQSSIIRNIKTTTATK